MALCRFEPGYRAWRLSYLTVIIRFLTYPFLAKQQESSRKMQQVQPQLKKLQEKYKNDKEKAVASADESYIGRTKSIRLAAASRW